MCRQAVLSPLVKAVVEGIRHQNVRIRSVCNASVGTLHDARVASMRLNASGDEDAVDDTCHRQGKGNEVQVGRTRNKKQANFFL